MGYWTDGTASLISAEFEAGWQVRGTPESPQWLSIILPRAGTVELGLAGEAIQGVPGNLLLARNQDVAQFAMRGNGHQYEALRLDWAIISQVLAAVLEVPFSSTLQLQPMLDLSTQSGHLLGSLAETMIAGMRDNGPLLHAPVAMANLTSALTDLVVRWIPHRFSHLLEKKVHLIAPRHVRRAIDFMHANIATPLDMSMVAEAAGVSVRSLESGFRVFKETTPAAYLRTIRLRAARADLLDPLNRQSVKDICLKWGFFQFGRFSAVYRASYGESPSDTKKRAASDI